MSVHTHYRNCILTYACIYRDRSSCIAMTTSFVISPFLKNSLLLTKKNATTRYDSNIGMYYMWTTIGLITICLIATAVNFGYHLHSCFKFCIDWYWKKLVLIMHVHVHGLVFLPLDQTLSNLDTFALEMLHVHVCTCLRCVQCMYSTCTSFRSYVSLLLV